MTEPLPVDASGVTALPAPKVTLITKPGCHLCSLARDVIRRVSDEMSVPWEETSINDIDNPDPMMWEQLPVTLIDGEPHDYWRVSESRLRASIQAKMQAASQAG